MLDKESILNYLDKKTKNDEDILIKGSNSSIDK